MKNIIIACVLLNEKRKLFRISVISYNTKQNQPVKEETGS